MAFRTNKVPAIEERTVSGSSVSFHSNFALPLKACKVSFEGTQEGSGTTSPTNKRPLTYKSNVSISDNGSSNIISLGGRRFYKFDLDVINGILKPTMEIVTIDENSDIRIGNYAYIKSDACDFYVPFEQIYPNSSAGSHPLSFARCDTLSPENVQIWGNVGYPNRYGVNQAQFHCNIANDLLGITDYTQETTTTALAKIKAWLVDNPITCAIPINETIQLTPTQLSTILGNNTFSTDTGTLEITFSDLQEKTASGSVASFNCALNKPLVACTTEFMCTEIGTGEKSPSNPYQLVGVDEVGIQQTGGNLWNEVYELGYYVNGAKTSSTTSICSTDKIPVLEGTSVFCVSPIALYVTFYDKNGNYKSDVSGVDAYGRKYVTKNTVLTIPDGVGYITFFINQAIYNHDISINADSTDTTYHAYVANTVTLIDLDGTRYGGYVDVVGEKLVLTKQIKIYDGSEEPAYTNWRPKDNSVGWIYEYPLDENIYAEKSSDYLTTAICDKLTPKTYSQVYSGDDNLFSIHITSSNKKWVCIRVTDTSLTNRTAINDWLANNPITIVYPLETPIEIPLSDIPTLSTIIGNNSFASDTGDISLTFNDLDLAKRGSFREVFKLP